MRKIEESPTIDSTVIHSLVSHTTTRTDIRCCHHISHAHQEFVYTSQSYHPIFKTRRRNPTPSQDRRAGDNT